MRYIPNEVAITTQSVLDGMRITHAYYHSTDGIWEFFPDQEWDYDDLRLVAMEEIVNKDYRLLDVILKMTEQKAAIYDKDKQRWVIVPYSYTD
ncbi:MAG: hypothetical protein II670_11155 [Alphaproteobacteria bacterium]|nr:hypothetical protein [Alphaproteobacteria bacterium]